jgi:hypothetical protein
MVATPSTPSTLSTFYNSLQLSSAIALAKADFTFHLSPFAFLLLSDERGEQNLKIAPEVIAAGGYNVIVKYVH